MRYGLTLAILFSSLTWSAIGIAQAQVFTYRAPRYPVSPESCPVAAQALGEQFSRLTGLTVGRTGCEVKVYGTIDVVVTYAADVPVKVVSTFDPHALELGFYEKQHDCETALPLEITKFQEYTGLEPLVSYCYSTNGPFKTDKTKPYVARVDAVGSAARRPIAFEKLLFGQLREMPAGITQQIEEAAKARGLLWPRAVIAAAGGGINRLLLRYYGERAKPIALLQDTSYEDLWTCNQRQGEVRDLLGRAGLEPMALFCTEREFRTSAELYALVFVQGGYEKLTLDAQYESMTACDEDRASVTGWYRTSLSKDVIGALCTYQPKVLGQGSSGFRMLVYVRL